MALMGPASWAIVQYPLIWLSNVELTTSRGDIERTGCPPDPWLPAQTFPLPPLSYVGLSYAEGSVDKVAGQNGY